MAGQQKTERETAARATKLNGILCKINKQNSSSSEIESETETK